MRYEGQLIRKRIAIGSKSERDAIVLLTEGGEYVLRRAGADTFGDQQLDHVVGKRVACEGQVLDYLLIFSECEEL